MTRIALITGGNRGLGRAAAEALADDGTDVIITFRSHADEAKEVVESLHARDRQAAAIRLDTTLPETFADFRSTLQAELSDRWGREDFDILISNGGFEGKTPYGQTDPATMDALYGVHVKGPILLTEMLTPLMRDGGRVVFLSTGLTRYVANPVYSAYAAMKGAIEVYTKYAAKALGGRAITVNVVAPGATATDFGGGMIRDDEGYRAMITRNHAFGRVGEPQDIGGAVRAITAESASWVTAQRIEASGGQSL